MDSMMAQTYQMIGKPQMQTDQESESDIKLKRRLQEIMQKDGIKQVEVSRETGINISSLSLWLKGSLQGHSVKIADKVKSYLENYMSNKPRMNSHHFSKLNYLKQPNDRIQDGTLFDQPENQFGSLIPLKIELEVEGGKRIKEVMLWDKNEPYLTLDKFTLILLQEYNLSSAYEQEIQSQIKR